MPSAKLVNLCNQWLQPIRDRVPADFSEEDSDAFQAALNEEALRRFRSFLDGVLAYQQCPVQRGVTEKPCIWQAGTTRLLDYAPDTDHPVILVIPSLVNRFDILDIDENRSFLRFLAASGYRPLVIDWGEPGEEETDFSIADYMAARLLPVLDFVAKENGPVHLTGYCMGGVLAVALAMMAPEKIKTLSLLATPWDFVSGVGGVPGYGTPRGRLFMQQAKKTQDYLEDVGVLPASFLQAVFTSFQPLNILQKFSHFADVEASSNVGRFFALTEDWLNDGVPLALKVSKECLQDWYGNNLTAKGEWKIGDLLIDPTKLTMPAFVLAAQRDKIVPMEAALPLSELIPNVTLQTPDMGHIGLMVSARAQKLAWEPLCRWLKLF